MKPEFTDADRWWSAVDDEKRAFFRDVMALADSVEDGEVLRLEFNGHNFTPSLFWATNEPPKTRRSPSTPACIAPDVWWPGLSAGMREAVRTLGGLVVELERDRNKAIEVRRTPRGFNATLVLRFKKPVGGAAAGN
jgi:hypothetical protein